MYNSPMENESNQYNESRFVPQFANIMGESLLPPSASLEDRLSVDDFEAKYPIRAALFSEFSTLRTNFSKEALIQNNRLGKFLYVLNSLDKYVTEHEGGNVTLWTGQFEGYKGVKNGWEKGETDGRVKMPTSTGKTVLFSELIESIGTKTNNGEDINTLIVVPDKKPVTQTQAQMRKFAPEIPVGLVYGNRKDIGEKRKPVTVITDESLAINVSKGTIDPLDYDLLVLDEADVYLSPKKQAVIKQFANAIKIGFSATMEYNSKKKVENYLPYEYYIQDIINSASIGELRPFSILIAKSTTDIRNIRIIGGDYSEADLEKVLDIEPRNIAAVELYKKMFEGKSTVAFCLGVSHAAKLAQMYQDEGITAEHISGYMSDDERLEIYNRFKKGETKILCNADLLIRSFDEPLAKVCFNLRPTLSKVVADQRAGRVLRMYPNDPNKHAYVVDFIDESKDLQRKPVLFTRIVVQVED